MITEVNDAPPTPYWKPVLGFLALAAFVVAIVVQLGTLESGPEATPPQAPTPSPQSVEPEPSVPPQPQRPGTTDEIMKDVGTESIVSIQELRGLPQADLVANLRGGKPIIRVTSLAILWERGQRDLVRKHAAGEPLLKAQLRALEARKP